MTSLFRKLVLLVLGAGLFFWHELKARERAYPQLQFEIIDITPEMRADEPWSSIPPELGRALVGDVPVTFEKQFPTLTFGRLITHVDGKQVMNSQEALDAIARAWLGDFPTVTLRIYSPRNKRFETLRLPFKQIEILRGQIN